MAAACTASAKRGVDRRALSCVLILASASRSEHRPRGASATIRCSRSASAGGEPPALADAAARRRRRVRRVRAPPAVTPVTAAAGRRACPARAVSPPCAAPAAAGVVPPPPGPCATVAVLPLAADRAERRVGLGLEQGDDDDHRERGDDNRLNGYPAQALSRHLRDPQNTSGPHAASSMSDAHERLMRAR